MPEALWHDYLYQPLFNIMIWLYNTTAGQNLGWAIVEMTILLRLCLLPFSLITERNRLKNLALYEEIARLEKVFASDPVQKKHEIRQALKKRKTSPWSKAVVLGLQALVLLLVYQVFLAGITGDQILKHLYTWVEFPGAINTTFFGFNLIDKNTFFWPAAVALFFAIEIYLENRRKQSTSTRSDLYFFLLFPAAVFYILWLLPIVKSLFILTSMLFSLFVSLLGPMIFGRFLSSTFKDEKSVKLAKN